MRRRGAISPASRGYPAKAVQHDLANNLGPSRMLDTELLQGRSYFNPDGLECLDVFRAKIGQDPDGFNAIIDFGTEAIDRK